MRKYKWRPLTVRRRGRIVTTKQHRVDSLGFGWYCYQINIRRRPPIKSIGITVHLYDGKSYVDISRL